METIVGTLGEDVGLCIEPWTCQWIRTRHPHTDAWRETDIGSAEPVGADRHH